MGMHVVKYVYAYIEHAHGYPMYAHAYRVTEYL